MRRLGPVVALMLLALASNAKAEPHAGPIRALAALDGALLSGGFDYTVKRWTIDPPKAATWTATWPGHHAPVTALAAKDGRVWSGDQAGRVLGRDAIDGAVRVEIADDPAAVTGLAVDASGRLAVAHRDGTLALYAADGTPVAQASAAAPLLAVLWDEGEIVVGGGDGGVRRYRLDGQNLVPTTLVAPGGMPVIGLATIEGGLLVLRGDGDLGRYDLSDGGRVAGVRAHANGAIALAAGADGTRAVTADAVGEVILWRFPGQVPVRAVAIDGEPVWAAAFLDSTTVALGGADGRVRLWRPGDDAVLASAAAGREALPEPHSEGARLFKKCVACHDLETLASGKPGPSFKGLFGRAAGSLPAFDYSSALANSGVVWTEATLDALLADGPDDYLPGSRMPLQRINDRDERRTLIAYLRRVAGTFPASGAQP